MFNLEYIRYAEHFRAIQIPIYYYVKTKGSLASQGMSISRTVKMKLTVFEDYHRFFRTVLDDEEYEKCRLKVYRFLLDAAGDGTVPPAVMPNSRKLGDERVQVSPHILDGEGALYDAFRERKLLDRYLETAALKNDLTLSDARLLLALWELNFQPTRQEAVDFADLSRSAVSVSLQRLTARGLVKVSDIRQGKERARRMDITFPEAAGPVLADLRIAQQNYESARLAALLPGELAQYNRLEVKIQDRIREMLQ